MSTDNQFVPKTGLVVTGGSLIAGASIDSIQNRVWRAEADGPNDRPVDIWWAGKWVPAWFSDIKAGDFYLLLDHKLEPDRCFYAASDCKRHMPRGNIYSAQEGHPTHIIRNGSQIVQAPALKDINTVALPEVKQALLGNSKE